MAGRIYLLSIGLFLCLLGSLFTYLMKRSYDRASNMHTWPQAEAVILESRINVEERTPLRGSSLSSAPFILYGYEWEGKYLTSNKVTKRSPYWSSKPEDAKKTVAQYPIGSRVPCFVNPQKHTEAVLEIESKAAGYSLWFPILFIIGGLGIIIGAFSSMFKTVHPAKTPSELL